MRKTLGAFAAMAILTGAGVAMAATADGTIKSIDLKANTFTLDSGTVFKAEKTVDLKRLKLGEKVAVTYDTKNGANEARAVKTMM